jgi:hypothetical protein
MPCYLILALTFAGSEIISVQSSKCINPIGGVSTSQANIVISTCNGTDFQRWNFNLIGQQQGLLYYTIQNLQNRLCLNVPYSSKVSGTNIQQFWCNGAVANSWWFRTLDPSTGKYKIINVNSGLSLNVNGGATADGTPLTQWPYSSTLTSNQWDITAGTSTESKSYRPLLDYAVYV